ncbi:MAG TPA: hypothetical protein VLE97_11240 [Gaiellaceae bacterium]|nr:hypothetical protein [Gaiellaceae bacterium]
MSASIKVTLYRDEGQAPAIVIMAAREKDAADVEWLAVVGTAQHLLRNYRAQLAEPQCVALEALLRAAEIV